MKTQEKGVLETVFDGLSDGVAVAEIDGRILYLNAKARALLGVPRGADAGATACSLICAHLRAPGCADCASACPLRQPGPRDAVTHQGEYGPRQAFDWKNFEIRRQERWLPLRVRCQRALVPGLGGDGEKHLLFIEDVSAQAALERDREDWRSMVAHDLRTPLTNVFATLRILSDIPPGQALDEKEARLAKNASRSCLRLLELINLFLDMARLESGAVPPQRRAVNLLDLAAETVEEQGPTARDKGVVFEVDVPKSLSARADPRLLSRVLENLVGNAVKFIPAGGRVVVAARPAPGRQVRLSVSDDGPGIPAAELPGLFERFRRGSAAGRVRGSGLGLAFCRAAVRAMEGEITAESNTGKGAAFHVVLPRQEEATP